MAKTPEERSEAARRAVNARWAKFRRGSVPASITVSTLAPALVLVIQDGIVQHPFTLPPAQQEH